MDKTEYIYTTEGKIKSKELADLILQGKKIEILNVENIKYKFYKDNKNGYDFAKINIDNQEYLIFFNRNEITGISKFDEELISSDITEIENEELVYKTIKSALLCKNGFEITSYYIDSNYEEYTFMIGFNYKNESYMTTIKSTPTKEEISTNANDNILYEIYYELDTDKFKELLTNDVDTAVLKKFIKEIENFRQTLEKESQDIEEIK